ncbi:HpcH/HpaI aldolase/citrate lyase family protein [Streptomyces calidiresistens]|uniref:ATP/GTP-binding protein n=1 Tax=Streptomyces calidiresistens TaxID=1485586 RepID=A0A7W3T0N7_9ACTN|nr:HpcH/HpaI aldolase/citrate lyase family protein [Streptomyces calidiresistens]MBB0228739.1 ATP/GTP-binding protein [Streptomyces calidiresistens]
MRHYGWLTDAERRTLFHREPVEFDLDSEVTTLGTALGATLYMPATRPRLAADIRKQARRGVVSIVLCLEDSISDAEVPGAEENIVRNLARLRREAPAEEVPLLFVRVRRPGQITELVLRLEEAVELLAGFVLPKFTAGTGPAYLDARTAAEVVSGRRILAMPVLESPEFLHLETRARSLTDTARLLDKHRERIPAVRLGVTDFCAAYGLRRNPEMTAYDVKIVASVISDVVNVFGRSDGTGYTITGPVWEYFRPRERLFRPQLRTSPFSGRGEEELRTHLIERDMDGLLREIGLDRANGLLGKTCIHPSHVPVVHALSVVTHEEYSDARDILADGVEGGGVLRSAYTNKMNEVKPHRTWAARTLRRAEVFGVAREDVDVVALLAAGLQ